MGATCAPQSDSEEEEEYNMEVEADQPSEKREPEPNEEPDHKECNVADDTAENLTKIINDYKAENEALKKQLEVCKADNNAEGAEDSEEKARQNEEIMKELAEMKALVLAKNELLVRGKLESALLSQATTMLKGRAITKLCIKGNLKNMKRRSSVRKSRKSKWVEIHVSYGRLTPDDYISGFVMLTHSDAKDAATAYRYVVIDVCADNDKGNELILCFKVLVQGSEITTDMIFACETPNERDEWIRHVTAALAEVKEDYETMHEEFTLKIKFEKEKLGFRIEETVIEAVEKHVERGTTGIDQGAVSKMITEIENVGTFAKKGVESVLHEVEDDEKYPKDPPCVLVVSDISDDALFTAGLKLRYAIVAINDINLVGKGYQEQLELLKVTPKPLTITFTGENFMREINEESHGYISILKELVSEEDNAVKKAFHNLINGTPFEEELKTSDDQTKTITAVLANQRRLLSLLQNFQINEMEL